MRASVAVAAFVGAVAVALAQTPLSCTPVPTPATPTPTPTPWPSVNPAGLCPNVCPGWGTLQAGVQFFANNTKVSGATKSINNIDTSDVLVTKATTSTGLWWIDQWQPGTYSLQYNVRDTCGRDSSTMAGYKATATLDYRCNNPPVVVARPAQLITTRYGAEVVLDATASFDFDQVDRTNLKFTWCLITRPTSFKDSTPYTTQYEDVTPFIHVPVGTAGAMNGVPLQGFALFKPTASGVYRFIVSVSDGCNVVQNEMRVIVTLTCCPHTAVANLQSNIQWSNQWVSSYSTMMDSFMTSNSSCLPPDYVMASARTAGTVYKNLYSPVVSDYMNATVNLASLPTSITPKNGCTWPGAKPAGSGAGAFDPAATYDDGSCQCSPNTDTWDVLTTPGSYVRRVDPTNTTAIVKTPGNLKFVTSLPSAQTWTSTCPQASETTWANITNPASRDIRIDTTAKITVNPLLNRPSTSWDATVSFQIANATMKTYANTNATMQTTAVGNTMCTIAVDTAPTGKNPTVSVTRGSGYDLKQCLGYYSFLLSSSSSDVCPLSTDQVDVEVVCPYPPFISLLCDVNYLLWDGTRFVKDIAAPTAGSTSDMLDGWVQLDARETTYLPTVQYALTLTSEPAPLTYLGAGATGPSAGMPELNPGTTTFLTASNTTNNLTAAFLPTRQGTYEVTLWGDDGCNSKSFDSVLVSTQCLPISPSASAAPSAAAAPLTGVAVSINASYATLGTAGNLNNRLNYAIRLTSRPQLPYGDVGKYTGTGNDAASFECMLGNSWSLTGTPNVLGLANAQKNNIAQGLAGTYNYAVTVLDACSRATDLTLSSTAPACTFPNNVTGAYVAGFPTQTVKWNNGGFATGSNAVPTLQVNVTAQATAPAGATIAWFMTGAPGTTTTKIYPSATPVAAASSIQCVANQATTWNVGQYAPAAGSSSILRAAGTADPYGPISSGTGLTFNNYVLSQNTIGAHTFIAQPMGQCDATTVGFTVTTACNNAARFTCAGSPNCDAGFFNPNGPSQTKSYWSSAVNRYAPVFVNSMADAGADAESQQDILLFTTTVTAPSATGAKQSWWSAAFFTETVSFTFSIPDTTDDLFQDATGYPNIVTAVRNALQTSLGAYAKLGTDNTNRVFFANTDLTTFITTNGGYANSSLSAPLGVWVTGGCYTPGWGRTFTATATYAIVPPKHFRAFGSVSQASANAEAKGYARTLTGLTLVDVVPLGVFDAQLRMDVPAMVGSALTAAYSGSRYAASSLSWVTPNPVITPNMFHFKTTVKTSSGSLQAFVTTSFLPDIDGVFSTAGAVIDDCPSAANTAATWPSTQITVIPPSCGTLTGLGLTQYDSSTSNNAASNAFTRSFSNSSTGFGPSWGYIGTAPSYTLTAGSTITANIVTACYNGFVADCGQKPTATNGGSVSFTGTNNQQYQLAAIPLPTNTNNGATIQFTYSGTSATPSNGGELHIGCTQTHQATYTNTTTGITWFYSVDSTTSAATAVTFLLPSDCLGGASAPDLIFATFPAMNTNSQPSWNVASINIYTHPASYGAIAATAAFSQTIMPTGQTGYVANSNGTASTTGINLGNAFFANSVGTTSNLPANTITITTAYSIAYSFPAWTTTTGTCSGSSTTASVTLKCPTYTPDITVTQSAYNLTNWHFNPASVQWTGFQSWASQLNTDFSFTFKVTGAPAASVLNAQNLASNILPAKLNNYWWTGYNTVANQPNWSPITQMCYAKNTIGQFANVNLTTWTRAFTGQTNTSWAAWIDPATVSVTLAPAYPSNSGQLPWIANPTLNGEYNKEYYNQLGQAAFIPDATTDGSSSYTIVTTLNDRCNPIVTKTATIAAPCTNANAVTVAWSQLGAAASITDAGSGRVMLKGTVTMPTGAAVFAEDAHVRKITWTITPVGAPSWVPAVKIYDADTLYPSFVPVWAGQYTVVLSIDIGNGCGPISSTSNSLTVGCSITATPAPVAVVAQGSTTSSTSFRRIGQNGLLTIPYLPNTGPNQDNIYWIGEATCPVIASWWNAASTVAYTCPTTQYSVRLVSVWPPVLMTNVNSQTIQLTVAIGSTGTTTPGIPQGLIDAIYYQNTLDGSAIVISIAGTTCTSPYVTDAANGKIICTITGLSTGVTTVPQRVTATILGVNSADVNGDLWVPFSLAPTITGVSGTAGLPTTGGNVIISGYNLAFPQYDPSYITANGGPNWSPALTQVTIDGRPCTGVSLVGMYSVGTNPQIQCTYMPGYGKQLAVSVQLFFQNMWTFAVSTSNVGTAYVFSYDAPYATNLVAQGSNALGGYWATATLKNFGPRFNTVNYQPPMDQSQSDTNMPLAGWWGYNDVRLQLGNNIPITMWNITSDESAGSSATVKFWIPSGCGAGLDLRVFRRNTWSAPNTGAGNSFSYAAPVVTCVGQPFNDPTRAGCTRVFIEGNNFGSSMNATLMNITFWTSTNQYHGQCDDVEYQPGSDYVRVSCRVPSSALPNDTVRVTNECGQSSGSSVSEARGLSVGSDAAPTLPSSIQLAGCGSAYAVGSSQSFSYAINAPMAPATEIRTDTVTKVQLHQGGEWKDQVLSNGLFIGLVLPLILLVVIVYPLYVCLAGRKQVGGAWNSSAAAGSSSSAAAAGDKTVTKGATRVTMNPVSFAPAPPMKPAEAPGAVHDNL